MTVSRMLPSAKGQNLGIPDHKFSVLNSPARTRPCQRLTPALASGCP